MENLHSSSLFFKVADGPSKRICQFQSFTHCSSDSGLILENILADVKLSYLAACAKIVISQIPFYFCFF